jgi:hypothetical protein
MRRPPSPLRSSLSLLLSALLLLAPMRVAFAQQAAPPPPPDESTERMKERFEKGQDYYEQRKFEAAAAEFRAAYEIKPAASLLYNEAVCYEKLKRYGTAANLFEEYLARSANPRDRRQVEDRIKVLKRAASPTRTPPVAGEKTVEQLEEAKPVGVFLIESQPPGATVYLNDKNTLLGTTPWNGTIDGKNKLIIVAQGYDEIERDVTGRPNQVTNLFFALSRQHYLGWLEVKANIPSADVYIDGKDAGSAGKTPFATNITPGKHTIIVSKEGFTEDVREVNIVAGAPHKIDFTLAKAPIGFVHVSGSSVEGARVSVDGKTVCEAAPCRFQTPSGERRITVEKKGLKPYSRKMTVVPATETSLAVKLEQKQARTDLIWKFGFAAVFIGGGIFMGLQANSLRSDIERDINAGNPPLPPDDDRFLRGKIFAFAADGLFLLGAVTTTVAVISLLGEKGPPSKGLAESRDLTTELTPPSPRRTPVVVSPAVGPGFAGVAAEVRW